MTYPLYFLTLLVGGYLRRAIAENMVACSEGPRPARAGAASPTASEPYLGISSASGSKTIDRNLQGGLPPYALEHSGNRLEQDLDVQPQAPVLDVVKIQLHVALK